MNNFMISAKRIITNKNTVTIIGVLVILIILYWGYKSTIDGAVKPVKVPVAAHLIESQTEVTASDINWIDVPSVTKPNNVLTNQSEIVGKYTGVNATIPEGSMFYKDVLVKPEDLPGNWLKLLKENPDGSIDVPHYLPVNVVTSYGNAIQPGTYIDIYMKAKDENDLIMYGKLIENIEVLAVKTSNGEDVFTSVESDKIPGYLYFGVSESLFVLLRKANYLNMIGLELVVVPHGGVNPVMGDIAVSSAYLRDYIEVYSVLIPTDEEYSKEFDENGNLIVNNNQNNG